MYAVVLTGGKQYKVSVGDILEVEKLDAKVGDKVDLEVLMLVNDDQTIVTDKLPKATCEVLSHGKSKKVVVYHFKPKKNERKKAGHRQPFTRIKIDTIG